MILVLIRKVAENLKVKKEYSQVPKYFAVSLLKISITYFGCVVLFWVELIEYLHVR